MSESLQYAIKSYSRIHAAVARALTVVHVKQDSPAQAFVVTVLLDSMQKTAEQVKIYS